MTSSNAKSTSQTHEDDVRCSCGRLIARRKPAHYEIKCPRCKERVDLPCLCQSGRSTPYSAQQMGEDAAKS